MSGTWELAELGKAATSLACPPHLWPGATSLPQRGLFRSLDFSPASWVALGCTSHRGTLLGPRAGPGPLFLALSLVPVQCLPSLGPVAGASGAQTGPARAALTVGVGRCSCAWEGPRAASLES